MRAWPLGRLLTAVSACMILFCSDVFCFQYSLSDSFSSQEVKQVSELRKLLGLEGQVVMTCNLALFLPLTDYWTADENCGKFDMGSGQGGQLAIIRTEMRNQQVASLLEVAYPVEEEPRGRWNFDKWAWTGLRRKEKTGDVRARGVYDLEQWEFPNGTQPKPGDYKNWLPGQPDVAKVKPGHARHGELGCFGDSPCSESYMKVNHHGVWDDSFEFLTHPYVCEYQGKYMVSSERKSWDAAEEACEKAGLQFAKIRSDEELGELVKAVGYFLGPDTETEKWDDGNWVWIAGQEQWLWADGTSIDWDIKWEPKEGYDSVVRSKHLAVSRWGTVDDSSEGTTATRPFACQCPEPDDES